MSDVKVGIDKIGLYIPKNYVDLAKLAELRGVDPNKWTKGIGQKKMSVVSKNEDIVSMGINSALSIIAKEDIKDIDQVIFATESGFDYSKAASTYLQEYLGLSEFIKAYEIKQACYSATAAIQIACDYVRLRPTKKVLVISSDISKYGANSSGEVTQGAGSIAMIIASNPSILEIEKNSNSITLNEYDFWRPDGEKYPFVDSKFSVELYIDVFKKLFNKKLENKEDVLKLDSILFHLPFSKMGKKALISLENEIEDEDIKTLFEKWYAHYEKSKIFAENVGNLYTGSLYLSLISLLLNGDLEDGADIGLFSYGSGCVAEFFTGKLANNYKKSINKTDIENRINNREEIKLEEYSKYFEDGIENNLENGDFFFEVKDNKRYYTK